MWRVPVRELKCIVDVLKDFLMEIELVFSENKITIDSVDPEKIVMVHLELQPSDQEYRCPTPIRFPLYIQSLFKILRGADRNDIVHLHILHPENDVMRVFTTNYENKIFLIRKLQDYAAPELALPTQPYFLTEKVSADNFYTSIRDMAAVGKVVHIFNRDSKVVFRTSDPMELTAEYEMETGVMHLALDNQYIIKYIEKFSRPGLNPSIYISLGKNVPLKCEWRMDSGCLVLYVAPLA